MLCSRTREHYASSATVNTEVWPIFHAIFYLSAFDLVHLMIQYYTDSFLLRFSAQAPASHYITPQRVASATTRLFTSTQEPLSTNILYLNCLKLYMWSNKKTHSELQGEGITRVSLDNIHWQALTEKENSVKMVLGLKTLCRHARQWHTAEGKRVACNSYLWPEMTNRRACFAGFAGFSAWNCWSARPRQRLRGNLEVSNSSRPLGQLTSRWHCGDCIPTVS